MGDCRYTFEESKSETWKTDRYKYDVSNWPEAWDTDRYKYEESNRPETWESDG